MLLYVTILISCVISLIGIFFKTKEDTKSGNHYRLTKVGWLLVVFLLTLSLVSIVIQVQRDKIQKLQDLNAREKKKADSLSQVYQQHTLELLLSRQIEKGKSDSLLLSAQINKLDSVGYGQSLSLAEQRSTLLEQRLNAAYLRNKLQEQEKATASMVYPLDTLYLNTSITLQLRDSVKAHFLADMKENIAPDERLFGSIGGINLLPIIKTQYPDFFRYLTNLNVMVLYRRVEGIPIDDMFTQFYIDADSDSTHLHPGHYRGCFYEKSFDKAQAVFSCGSDVCELNIYGVKSTAVATTYTTSFKELDGKKLMVQLNSSLPTDQQFIDKMQVNCIQLSTNKGHAYCDKMETGVINANSYSGTQHRVFSGKAKCYMW